MRSPKKSKAIAAIVIGAIVVLAAVAAYQYFAVRQPDGSMGSEVSRPASRQTASSNGSFVLHETPQPVAELSFVDGDGRERSLADFHGRTILLNIWATWCVPCREEMPALDRLQAELGNSEFEVVPLSIDRDGLPKVEAFYEELSLGDLGIYVDASGKAAYQLNTVGIPTTLLINSNGLEIGRLIGPAEWDSLQFVTLIQQQLEETSGEAS